MNTFITILFILAGIIALFLIVALLIRKSYNVRSEVIINAPVSKVFDYLKQLRNQDNFNKWVMTDPGMLRQFRGAENMPGFIYAWNGNTKAGEGELELKSFTENQKIETEIRFARPFEAVAYADYIFEAVSENQTKVTWTNTSKMKYPMNAMISMIEKMLAKDMAISLGNLKRILDKE